MNLHHILYPTMQLSMFFHRFRYILYYLRQCRGEEKIQKGGGHHPFVANKKTLGYFLQSQIIDINLQITTLASTFLS
jgi:hypothetical protein